jgi:hypothetical protein
MTSVVNDFPFEMWSAHIAGDSSEKWPSPAPPASGKQDGDASVWGSHLMLCDSDAELIYHAVAVC